MKLGKAIGIDCMKEGIVCMNVGIEDMKVVIDMNEGEP